MSYAKLSSHHISVGYEAPCMYESMNRDNLLSGEGMTTWHLFSTALVDSVTGMFSADGDSLGVVGP